MMLVVAAAVESNPNPDAPKAMPVEAFVGCVLLLAALVGVVLLVDKLSTWFKRSRQPPEEEFPDRITATAQAAAAAHRRSQDRLCPPEMVRGRDGLVLPVKFLGGIDVKAWVSDVATKPGEYKRDLILPSGWVAKGAWPKAYDPALDVVHLSVDVFKAPPGFVDPFADIPAHYGVTHFPAVQGGVEYWMPTCGGQYIASKFTDSAHDLQPVPGYGTRCASVGAAIQVIRDHIAWKNPKPLPRSEWVQPEKPQLTPLRDVKP